MVLTNQLRKYIKSLHTVKFRQKYNKFIAEGPKICKEFLISKKFKIEFIICTQQGANEFKAYLSELEGKTIVCSDKDLKTISGLKTSNKILIVLEQNLNNINTFPSDYPWAFYLDGIQDPGNMGTIMRIADWYGIKNVLISDDSVDIYNSKVVQSAMGAHLRVSTHEVTRDAVIEKYHDLLIAMCLEGTRIDELSFLKKGMIVIGNESKGVSKDVIKASKHKALIPRLGGAESLNASVACGIAAYAFIK